MSGRWNAALQLGDLVSRHSDFRVGWSGTQLQLGDPDSRSGPPRTAGVGRMLLLLSSSDPTRTNYLLIDARRFAILP